MSLTEREKEIARKCFEQYLKHSTSISAVNMFDEFLSRIREEQEASGIVSEYDYNQGVYAQLLWDLPVGTKLFTTPPASDPKEHDCSELVEALKELLSRVECDADSKIWWPDARHKARVALANHAKRMKLTQAISGEE